MTFIAFLSQKVSFQQLLLGRETFTSYRPEFAFQVDFWTLTLFGTDNQGVTQSTWGGLMWTDFSPFGLLDFWTDVDFCWTA